ncbi:MAG: hypothetical protein AAGI53_02480 [Planctomycetota bacterium]
MSWSGIEKTRERVVLRRSLASVVFYTLLNGVLIGFMSFSPFGTVVTMVIDAVNGSSPPPSQTITSVAMFIVVYGTALALHLRTLRWQVAFDFERQTVTFSGMTWFSPWWRPRFGTLEAPMGDLLDAHRIGIPRNFSVRFVFRNAVLSTPRAFGHWRTLRDVGASIAALNPPPPVIHSAAGMWAVFSTFGVVLWVAGIMYVLTTFF